MVKSCCQRSFCTRRGLRLSEHTTTECLLFPDIFDRPVVAKFDQRQGSSDGGAILLQAAERRLGLTSALAGCLRDDRQPGKVQHELSELITQRVMAIALGYEDANDAARLASDPIHKLLVGRNPLDGEDLASQPTLSRFENAPNRKELLRMTEALADRVIERHRKRLHGRQCGVEAQGGVGHEAGSSCVGDLGSNRACLWRVPIRDPQDLAMETTHHL